MPGRTHSSTVDGYAYSHNGQEKDDEIFQGALSAEYWEYDSRTGRRWENDPIVKPWESPYATFANNPIWYSDVNGLDAESGSDSGSGESEGNGDKGKSKDKGKDKAEGDKNKGKDKVEKPNTDTGTWLEEVSVIDEDQSHKGGINWGNLKDAFKAVGEMLGNRLNNLWQGWKNLNEPIENRTDMNDNTPPLKTTLSGYEESNKGPIKGNAFVSNGKIENTSGGYPGAFLGGVGSGLAGPKVESVESLVKALEGIKAFSNSFSTGGDVIETGKSILKVSDDESINSSIDQNTNNVMSIEFYKKDGKTQSKLTTKKGRENWVSDSLEKKGNRVTKVGNP